VLIIGSPALRGVVEQYFKGVGFEVQAYARAREWPFFGEIRSGRCFRTDQCGANALVVDAAPDALMSGPSLILHQVRQGCPCADPSRVRLSKLAILPDGRERDELLSHGVAVLNPDAPADALTIWAQRAIKQTPWNKQEESEPAAPQGKVLFMRCPYSGTVLPADSLKRLQTHFHSLGHLFAMKQVMKIRDENWCDASGNAVEHEGPLEAMRLSTD
jgi:hypothetical protein